MVDKATYTKPASQLDLEARLENENTSELRLSDAPSRVDEEPVREDGARDYRVEGNDVSAYVGVDPIYQNYADETHKPSRADDGAEAEVFERLDNDGKAVAEAAEKLKQEDEEPELGDDTSNAAEVTRGTVGTPPSPPTPGQNPGQQHPSQQS